MSVKKVVEEKCENCNPTTCCKNYGNWGKGGTSSGGCGVYCFGMIGAFVYFYPHIASFTDFLWAAGKSIVWPALLVYQALSLLKI